LNIKLVTHLDQPRQFVLLTFSTFGITLALVRKYCAMRVFRSAPGEPHSQGRFHPFLHIDIPTVPVEPAG
jgi:hypothetical protein